MRSTMFAITIPHLSSLSSALGVAINSCIITPSFNVNETLPENQSNILIPLFKINKEYRSTISSFFSNKIILSKKNFVIKREQSKSVLYFIIETLKQHQKQFQSRFFQDNDVRYRAQAIEALITLVQPHLSYKRKSI